MDSTINISQTFPQMPTHLGADVNSDPVFVGDSSKVNLNQNLYNNLSIKDFIKQQSKYAFDPHAWAYDIFKFKGDKWQNEAMQDFIDYRFLAWSAGSGVGKTALLSVLIWFFLSTRPFPITPCTAPTQHQLFDILWAELSRWQNKSPILMKAFKWTQTKIALRGCESTWFAVARTSKPKPGELVVEGLQGFHAPHILFVVDEASSVPDPVMMAVDGALTTAGAYSILASNPTRKSGYFHNVITNEKLQETFKVKFINAEDCLYADKSAIARAAEIYGKDSDYYRTKVLGVPPEAEAQSLITVEQVADAHERAATAEQREILEKMFGGKTVISCDPARFGPDDSMIYVGKGALLKARHVVHGMDTVEVAELLGSLSVLHDPAALYVDSIGIGSGVIDIYKKLFKKYASKCHGINIGENGAQPERFLNLRAELFFGLGGLINVIGIAIPTEYLDEELPKIRYMYDNRDRKIKLPPKDQLRPLFRPPRSPNDSDALTLMFVKELSKFLNCPINPTKHAKLSLTLVKGGATEVDVEGSKVISRPSPFVSINGGGARAVGFGSDRYSSFNSSSDSDID